LLYSISVVSTITKGFHYDKMRLITTLERQRFTSDP
jgi:hypothetical protein